MDQAIPPRDQAPSSRLGELIAQRYRLEAIVGEGGLGTVFRATDVSNNATVAVKLLKREVSQDAETVARFDREAKALVALDHEHIVRALNFGRTPDGDICLVLELVQGETLRTVLKKLKPFGPQLTLELARQIAAALDRAHGLGIVHRDLKPENVMVVWGADQRPWVKMLDFGMARILTGSGATPLTRKGAVFGTPEYMPPEQAMGKPVDARADQYAFGVMLYEMIAGRRPFAAKTPLEMLQLHIREQPGSLVAQVPQLPIGVEQVVLRMLAKKPEERFESVGQAVGALWAAAYPSG